MRGFTLIEMLMVIAFLAVVMVLAIPMTKQYLAENKTTTTANRIIGALALARSEAIKNAVPVVFCPSQDQQSCSGNWSDGQIVIMGTAVLRHLPALPSRDQLSWRGSLGKNNGIEFLPSGFTNGQNGSFHYCPQGKRSYAAAIIVDKSGRVRVNKTGTVSWPLDCG